MHDEHPNLSVRQHQLPVLRLFPPRPVSNAITRTNLVEMLLDAKTPPVVLIEAPAGYGKSTLMQQLKSASEDLGICTGWLTLDDSDNDLNRLSRDMQLLIDQLPDKIRSHGSGRKILSSGRYGQISPSDWILTQLVSLGNRVTILIDDFQQLVNRNALLFFQNLLLRAPDEVRFIISSRTIPDMKVAELAVIQRLLLLQTDQLKFSRSEGRKFLTQLDLGLSNKEVGLIYSKTEGWPVALQLYRLSLAHADVRESLIDFSEFEKDQLAAYLSDNVLALLSTDLQQFLLESSLFFQMSGPLCDAVLGRTNSLSILNKLESSGFFVTSLEPTMQWFQYHSLFAGFLRAHFENGHPQRVHQIHSGAANWFYENRMYESALHHALAISDNRLAARILEEWSSFLIMEGNLTTVIKWYERIHLQVVREFPQLIIRVAWALAYIHDIAKHREIVQLLDIEFKNNGDCETEQQDVVRSIICIMQDDFLGAMTYSDSVNVYRECLDDFSIFEVGAACILKSHVALNKGELEVAREFFLLGRSYGYLANASFTVLGSFALNAVYHLLKGQLEDALNSLYDALESTRVTLDQSVALASFTATQISVLYESNKIEESLSVFEKYHSVIGAAAQLDFIVISYVSMSRVYDMKGKPGQAQSLLDRSESIAHSHSWPRLIRILAWERVRRALISGNLDLAKSLASRIKKPAMTMSDYWVPFSEDVEGDVISRIRLAIYESETKTALPELDHQIQLASKQQRVRRLIKLHILKALAYHKSNKKNKALRNLQVALQFAQPGRYIRIFLDEGPLMVDFLKEANQTLIAQSNINSPVRSPVRSTLTFLASLLEAAGIKNIENINKDIHKLQLLDVLSPREDEILRALASGMSNRDICSSIVVSENTVKFHLKNIYSKLGVNSRVQAIKLAQDIGLL